MARINQHYLNLAAGYLFPEIGRRVKAFGKDHPDASLIRLGIGDVVLPLVPAVVQAFHEGVEEMGEAASFHGYGPEQGYEFLREAVAEHDYRRAGVTVHPDEIFISDGSKCDSGNIQEIFSADCQVAVTDPVYPVYVDTNIMAGRGGAAQASGHYEGICYLPCTAENNFSPELPKQKVELIYLCSPNNPTGAVMTHADLKRWVDYARRERVTILFDAAYEAFIREDHLPHSIYEIEGAREVAIEFRSFSKKAGFTGTRCAFTVVPQELTGRDDQGREMSLHQLWYRRQTTKFNGVSYPVQKAAAACYSKEGQRQIQENINYYMDNAAIIVAGLKALNIDVYGGRNAPYIWFKVPGGLDSWTFFDKLLHEVHVVGTPGAGFGPVGEGYFRLSAFGRRGDIEEAVDRLRTRLRL